MITRSKDGIYEPKAFHDKTAAALSAPTSVAYDANPTFAPLTVVKCAKPSNQVPLLNLITPIQSH